MIGAKVRGSRVFAQIFNIALVMAALAPASAQETLTRDALVAADYVKGRAAFQSRCSACHTLAEGATDLSGPALFGMFGRRIGAKDGFAFSAALTGVDFSWTPDCLVAWLADPTGYLPRNVMMIPEPVPMPRRIGRSLQPNGFRVFGIT